MRSFLRVLFWLVLVEEAIALSLPSILEEVQHHATTHESSTSSSNLRVRTLSSTTVTTPDCSVIRRAPYPAELQLFYEYSIEFKAGRAVSLTDMERHIANAVAIQLNICDTSGRPVFKVRTDAPHRFSDKICVPEVQDSNGCIVVKGQTAILLDNDSSLIRTKAYDAIENSLDDPDLLEGYTDSVVRTAFLSRGNALLVEAGQASDQNNEADSHISPITATIAVAAASVSFVVASLFCYGFMRRDGRHHPEPSVRHKGRGLKSTARTVVSDSLGGRARRHFVRLEDLTASPTSYVTASLTPMSRGYDYDYEETEVQGYGDNYNTTVAWSVSDITSDSVSLRSGISRTPSMLERIEEEDEEDREKESDTENHGKNDFEPIVIQGEFHAGTGQSRKNVEDYDCKSLKRNEMMDVSDLDACFTIAQVSDETQTYVFFDSEKEADGIDLNEASPVNDDSPDDVWSDGTPENSPETSESDFSGSSLLVLADMSEYGCETTETRSQAKVDISEADRNTLEYSRSTSETVEFANPGTQTTGEVCDMPVTEEEDEDPETIVQSPAIPFKNQDMSCTCVDTATNEQEAPQDQFLEAGCRKKPSNDELPGLTDGTIVTVEDSIEEWVSELLDQPPKKT